MKRGRILFLVVALVLLGAGWWIYENMTLEEVRVPGFPKGEAATNELYAAQRLLSALGAEAHSRIGFKALPEGDPRRAALILPTKRRVLTQQQRRQLLDWAGAGGHLIVVTYTLPSEGDPPDPLMDELGVTQFVKKE